MPPATDAMHVAFLHWPHHHMLCRSALGLNQWRSWASDQLRIEQGMARAVGQKDGKIQVVTLSHILTETSIRGNYG